MNYDYRFADNTVFILSINPSLSGMKISIDFKLLDSNKNMVQDFEPYFKNISAITLNQVRQFLLGNVQVKFLVFSCCATGEDNELYSALVNHIATKYASIKLGAQWMYKIATHDIK